MEQAEEFVKPIFKDGEIILEVECGQNKAAMYLSKLCQGSKGPCISFQGSWLTPNEFQFVSGRETAKDWKRSIRHHGKSLKLLLAKGILSVHPTMCDCEGCRIGAVLTRKGEKRRIPNGERKRKSTGNAPENSGSGAFRAVGNLAKAQDGSGLLDPKRPVMEKFVEASQSPLKESSLLNLPDMKSDVSACLVTHTLAPDANKAVSDVGLSVAPLPAAAPVERLADINGNTPPSTGCASKDAADSAARLLTVDKPKASERQRHCSSSSNSSNPQHHGDKITASSHQVVDAAELGVAAASADVRVLSSSGGATLSSIDKSLSRLALHQAAAATVKTTEEVSGVKAEAAGSGIPAAKTDSSAKEERVSSEQRREKQSDSASKSSSRKEAKEGSNSSGDAKPKLEKVASAPLPPSAAAVCDKNASGEAKGKGDDRVSKVASDHSASAHRPREQCSSKTAAPVSNSSMPTTTTTHKSTQSKDSVRDESKHKHSSSSLSSSLLPFPASTPSAAATSASLSSPSSDVARHPERGDHYTIKHVTGEHRPEERHAASRHAAGKAADHHHHAPPPSERKERKADASVSADKERHASRDKESGSSSGARHGDREAERRKHEDKAQDKERGRAAAVGGSGSGGKSAFTAEKHDPLPAQEFPGGALTRSDGSAEAAAFSDYMRVLAAGHHGLMPPPSACLPPMFPVRGPDVAVSTGLLHPMHACSMFSTPGALLPKDPVMYPTSAGTLPSPYAAPSVTPLHVMQPHQFPPAAATTSVLDYTRQYAYPLPWASSLPLMVPDAMTAAAAAAAAAAASSAGAAAAAKRSREEVDSAVDLSSKRLRLDPQLSAAGYAPAMSITPLDYMASYRGIPSMSCGMESSLYDKSSAAADYMRKRLYPEMPSASASGSLKGLESHYLASLPDYYRALYCCGCMENRPEDVRTWSVEDVFKFVSSLDGCSVYAEIFREQRVDGKILVLLTTEHLMKSLGMKLGPAILLTQRVSKILQDATRASGCDMCKRLATMVPALHNVGY